MAFFERRLHEMVMRGLPNSGDAFSPSVLAGARDRHWRSSAADFAAL
jgi:hypothetical protein